MRNINASIVKIFWFVLPQVPLGTIELCGCDVTEDEEVQEYEYFSKANAAPIARLF